MAQERPSVALQLVNTETDELDRTARLTIECDVLETSRARIYMAGGVITVDEAIYLGSDQSEDPGPNGLRISPLHGPGLVQRSTPVRSAKALSLFSFRPVRIGATVMISSGETCTPPWSRMAQMERIRC